MNVQHLTREQRIFAVMLKLSDLHETEFTETQQELWETALEPYSAEEVEQAFLAHVRETEPLYRLIPSILTKHIEHGRRNRAENAFLILASATRNRASARQSVAFGDPLIHIAVMQMGGWGVAYYSIIDHEQIDDYRINFARTYERLAKGPKLPHPAYLPGRDDKPGGRGEYVWIGNEGEVDRVVATGYDPHEPPTSSYLDHSGFPQLPPH